MPESNKTAEAALERDLWPTVPTREEMVKAGVPLTYDFTDALTRVWPAMTIAEKAELGFTQEARRDEIDRLILIAKKVKDTAV